MISDHKIAVYGTPEGSSSFLLDKKAEIGVREVKFSLDAAPALTTGRLLKFLPEFALAISPLLFIALSIAALILDGHRVTNAGLETRFEEALRIGATVFPILFAAIACRTLRILARFQAGRGERLGILEMLLASRSVWSTFEIQFAVRQPTLVGALLVVFWAFSPIGGQASLRLASTRYADRPSTFHVRYFDTGPAAGIWPYGGFSSAEQGDQYQAVQNSLLSACLLSSDQEKGSPQDPWGNVKIPRLEAFDESAADEQGWIVVNSGNVSYLYGKI